MIVDLFGVKGLFTSLITRGFVESHLKDKLKFEVVPKDDVGQKFKDAVKKEFNANFLDDSDFIVRFAIPKVEKDPEEDNEETDQEDNDQEEKDTEKKDDQEEKDQEEVNESIKVQDLSKRVGLQTIGAKKSSTKKAKWVKETEKKSDKKEDKKSEYKASKNTEGDKKDIEEAETTATGAELKKKIIENIKRTLHSDDDNIELNDLPDYMEGYDVCFVKIGLNNKNKKKDEQ